MNNLSSQQQQNLINEPKYNIAMCCDFFYPRLGGVETHIFQLALMLIEKGHKVIIVTHQYDNRTGIRYVTNGLKVYYIPIKIFADAIMYPAQVCLLPLFRKIMIREKIQIVHAHAVTSTICQESLIHARTMGLKTVFTDHSLFNFADPASIHLHKLSKFYFSDIDHAIAVSLTVKENLSLRAFMNPKKISVIPNSVDSARFQPDPSQRPNDGKINIVVITRLTYRKGVDLLIDIIPKICKKFENVHFIIGGDGPKMPIIDQMARKNNLQDRVEFLGALQHKDVRNVLVKGHIFLNTSITEAFCIAIVEAVSCGLLVVSTNVGGIPEVLPQGMAYLRDPNPKSMTQGIEEAMQHTQSIPSWEFHERVKNMYNWRNAADRTEAVYDNIMQQPQPTLLQRFRRYLSVGPMAGIIMLAIIVFDFIFYNILNYLEPVDQIDEAINFPCQQYSQQENKEYFGDHSINYLQCTQELKNQKDNIYQKNNNLLSNNKNKFLKENFPQSKQNNLDLKKKKK